MNKLKIAFYGVTGLLSLMLLFAAIGNYFLNTAAIKEAFGALGFPAFIVIPLGIAKIAGVIVLLTRFNKTLVEWAYAGFFFNFILAASAHLSVGDGEAVGSFVALLLLGISYILQRRAFSNSEPAIS